MTDSRNCAWLTFTAALGPILLLADDRGLTGIALPGSSKHNPPPGEPHSRHPLLVEAARQISEYLAGKRTVFTLPLSPRGTSFQLRTWEIIGSIPFGRTMTYGEIALLLGGRGKARAVGAAAGANPLPLVIPCHRVIGADNSLTGFACGLAMKERLLQLEGVLLNR